MRLGQPFRLVKSVAALLPLALPSAPRRTWLPRPGGCEAAWPPSSGPPPEPGVAELDPDEGWESRFVGATAGRPAPVEPKKLVLPLEPPMAMEPL